MITGAQLPSKKANRSCSPNKAEAAVRERCCYTRQLGFTVASDLAGPRACISPSTQPLQDKQTTTTYTVRDER